MSQIALGLSSIVKTFPGIVALDDMNFELRVGEIHAICGENGAGKSTLMKVVSGVHAPDRGTISLFDREEKITSPLDAFSKGIAIIHQETSLFEEMTVLDNLFLGREIIKKAGPFTVLDYKAMAEKMGNILKGLHISIPVDEKIKNLGMAQKQMVEIAKALTFESRILILDEPTASLTQEEVDALFTIIRGLRDQGVSVVYISHRLEEIFTLCDRVTVIRDGHYISTRKVSETNKDELVADMVGRSMDSYYPKAEVEIGGELFSVKGLGAQELLHDINFTIRKGEILGFAGLAGSGRTELALTLSGFTPPVRGEITLEGRPVRFKNYRQAMEQGLVYVSEDRGKYGIIVNMSVKNNIVMPQLERIARWGVINHEQEYTVAEKMRESMGIKAPDTDFLVMNLSGGNQQKVSVSKALALSPKLLILDEPTRGVDVGAKAEIHRIISKMAVSGLTILMISSELPELIGMCDRIYVMKDGTIAGCFNRDQFSQEEILRIALASEGKKEAAL
ncbi:sugar ABC transporter ATP-binding protein [Treponema primitia]|uniref:sugar ABC transporter ATP-binding protein n=1 Tax=Treponema primitia TaxID=88058 RepID=UPI000255566E|nr:sugar ABC transporter ATP-binding protein [Treponema primitia]